MVILSKRDLNAQLAGYLSRLQPFLTISPLRPILLELHFEADRGKETETFRSCHTHVAVDPVRR